MGCPAVLWLALHILDTLWVGWSRKSSMQTVDDLKAPKDSIVKLSFMCGAATFTDQATSKFIETHLLVNKLSVLEPKPEPEPQSKLLIHFFTN
jgi:hypothetical protein